MSPEIVQWLYVGHIFGFVMWVGTMFGLFQILQAHAQDKTAASAFGPLEKNVAGAMDVGAALTLIFGILLIVGPPNGTAIFKAGGFFHIKLTLVVGLLAAHGILRVRVRKYREGQVKALPQWMFPLLSLGVLAIIIMIIVRPFAK